MWLFWIIPIEIAWYSIDIGFLIDIIAIVLIIIVTIYTTKKKKKNDEGKDNKHTDSKIGIDEQKWFVLENNVKKNIRKYQDVKWYIITFFCVPLLILSTFSCITFLYSIITKEPNLEAGTDLIIFFVLLLVSTLLFIKIKKTLDKIEKNLLYKIIKIFLGMLIVFGFSIGWLFVSDTICNKLKLSNWLSWIIKPLFRFLSIMLWFFFIWFISNFLSSKDNSSKKTWNSKQKNNKKTIEEKTWYNQWPLLN